MDECKPLARGGAVAEVCDPDSLRPAELAPPPPPAGQSDQTANFDAPCPSVHFADETILGNNEATLAVGPGRQCASNHRVAFYSRKEGLEFVKHSVGLTGQVHLLEIEGLCTQGSRPGRNAGRSVGGIVELDSSDWANGIQYQTFDTRPDTEFKRRCKQSLPGPTWGAAPCSGPSLRPSR